MNFAQAILGDVPRDGVALLTEDAEHSYADLHRAVGAVERFLEEQGARKGHCVALLTENSLFAVAAYLGTLRAGLTAVPLPTSLSKEQCRFIVETTGVRVAFVQAKVAEEFAGALTGVRAVVVDKPLEAPLPLPMKTFQALLEASGPLPPVADTTGQDLAVLMFTSGSTSQPRGVMLTHANLLANTGSILGYLPLSSADRAMMVLPFYYSFGASLLHTHLKVGGSLVFDRRFMFPDKVLARLKETRCTGFAGVPSHFQVLLRRSKLKAMTFPDLRWIQQAGGKLPAHFIEELSAAVPQAKLYIMYGATEATARLCCLPPDRLASKLGSVGKAIPGVRIELLDEHGTAVPPGQVGEIVATGANIAQGYFKAPMETEATFRQGKLRTGDLAFEDGDGFLYIVDRAKDFIKVAGNRTSTKMLEEQLLRFPDIVEAAVLGMPDDTLGEAVALFVVPRIPEDGAIAEKVLAFAQNHLPAHLVPRRIHTLKTLPKNNAGKVMRVALRELLALPGA